MGLVKAVLRLSGLGKKQASPVFLRYSELCHCCSTRRSCRPARRPVQWAGVLKSSMKCGAGSLGPWVRSCSAQCPAHSRGPPWAEPPRPALLGDPPLPQASHGCRLGSWHQLAPPHRSFSKYYAFWGVGFSCCNWQLSFTACRSNELLMGGKI